MVLKKVRLLMWDKNNGSSMKRIEPDESLQRTLSVLFPHDLRAVSPSEDTPLQPEEALLQGNTTLCQNLEGTLWLMAEAAEKREKTPLNAMAPDVTPQHFLFARQDKTRQENDNARYLKEWDEPTTLSLIRTSLPLPKQKSIKRGYAC